MARTLRTIALSIIALLALTVLAMCCMKLTATLLDMGPVASTDPLPDIGSSDREDLELRLAMQEAHAASAALWVSQVQLGLTIFTTLGVVASVALAFNSVVQTREIFRRQNTTTRAELRAYVSVHASVERLRVGQKPRVVLALSNTGATPAYNARVSLAFAYQQAVDDDAIDYSMGRPFPPIIINPSSSSSARSTLSTPLTRPMFTDLKDTASTRWHVFTVVGRVDYEDTFGDPHFTCFAQFFWGEDVSEKGNLPLGNDAT